MNVLDLRSHLNKGIGARDSLLSQLERSRDKGVALAEALEATQMAQAVAQQSAKDTQDQLKFHITDLVQSALDAVFPDRYKYGVEFELKRGQSEARLYLERDGVQSNPMQSNGGGVVDILSLSMRMACWMLSRSENVLLLDEPFKNLSVQYRPIMAEILYELANKLGLQIIMVTHDADQVSIADRTFTVSRDKDGVSWVQASDKE